MSFFTDAMRHGASLFNKATLDYFSLGHNNQVAGTCSMGAVLVGTGRIDLDKVYDRQEPVWIEGASATQQDQQTVFDILADDFPILRDQDACYTFVDTVRDAHGDNLIVESGLDCATNLGQAISSINDGTDFSVGQIADLLDNSGVFEVEDVVVEDTSAFDGTYDSQGY